MDRNYGLSIARALLPFVLILTVSGQSYSLLAALCGETLLSYNEALEGAYILRHRSALRAGVFPGGVEVYLAGTSRTMADYDPLVVSETLSEAGVLPTKPTVRNLGNVANYPTQFEVQLGVNDTAALRLLILEFSPSVFVRETQSPRRLSTYARYRASVRILELATAGWLRRGLGLEDTVVVKPNTLYHLWTRSREERLSLAELFYAFRASHGYGQRLGHGGHVAYRAYLPDRRAGALVRDISSGELERLKRLILSGQENREEWDAFVRLMRSNSGFQVAIVRPPVDEMLYRFENEHLGDLIERMERIAIQEGVAYIDLNPHDLFLTDFSHIDWYEVPRASRAMAAQVAEQIDWSAFRKTSRLRR